VPLDEALGIAPYQQSSEELVRLGCLLSVMMPYAQASAVLRQWSGLYVSAASLWNWVQQVGQRAEVALAEALGAQASGETVTPEALDDPLAALPLAIGADGVMVPFRPTPKTPMGAIQWREVKVGILARLGTRVTRAGKTVPQLLRRRLVAVLGTIDDFIPPLQLEATRQGVDTAPLVVWLSDGGRGFWRVYRTCFATAVAVLDFFHAASHLARATEALFGTRRSPEAQAWFRRWRHWLRHGQAHRVRQVLTQLIHLPGWSTSAFATLLQVQAYFQRHHHHTRYQTFDRLGLPLGSGMVESACKWLIQQRFKGVGMRWSDDGFNHLLLLRLAWANDRFDALFPSVPSSLTNPSPNP
jgi:hypothetical protein